MDTDEKRIAAALTPDEYRQFWELKAHFERKFNVSKVSATSVIRHALISLAKQEGLLSDECPSS
jgi:predicted transcriptional regulator